MISLPVDRHARATFATGARVFDQATRTNGTVTATRIEHRIIAAPAVQTGAPAATIFTVPNSEDFETVTVQLDSGAVVDRQARDLHASTVDQVKQLIDPTRLKGKV